MKRRDVELVITFDTEEERDTALDLLSAKYNCDAFSDVYSSDNAELDARALLISTDVPYRGDLYTHTNKIFGDIVERCEAIGIMFPELSSVDETGYVFEESNESRWPTVPNGQVMDYYERAKNFLGTDVLCDRIIDNLSTAQLKEILEAILNHYSEDEFFED